MKQKDSGPKANEIQIDASQVSRIKAEKYVVDIMIDHTPWRLLLPTPSRSSLMASLAYLAAIHSPRVEGWNIYEAEGPDAGRLLESVSTLDFVGNVTRMTPLKDDPSGGVSKGFIPLVSPTSEAFQEMVEKAKKEGKVPK